MKTIESEIESACANTPPFTRDRKKALSQIKWRLRFGLLYAGLDDQAKCVLVSADDPRCQTFDGRDNERMKLAYYSAVLRCKFEVELV